MSLTQTEARDAVIGVVDTAWKASGAATENVLLQYGGRTADKPGAGGVASQPASFGRVSVQTISSGQSTLGASRRYETDGIVTVQIFTPAGDGWALADQFARVVLNALRSHTSSPSSLWFFDETPNEIGPDGPWLRMDVVANFRYQEVIG